MDAKMIPGLMLFLIVFCAFLLIPLRPVIFVQNATSERVYIRADELIYGVEPDPEEVEKIIKAKPDIVEAGENIKLTASFFPIIKDGYVFNIGWLTGGRRSFSANGSGGQSFLFSPKVGVCSAKLIIKPGYHNFEVSDKKEGICLAKLQMIKGY